MTSTVFAETGTMKVSAKRVSSYSVTIPSTLSLTTTDKQNFTGTYTVGVKGDVAANDTVYLRPQNTSFEMIGKADSNNKSTASVTQTKTEWSGSEIDNSSFTETTGDVEVEITHADEYEGNLVFDYGLEINLQPGFYTSDGTMIASWTDAGFTDVDGSAIGTYIRANRNITKVVLPSETLTIGNGVFSGCDALQSVVIPDSVTSIGQMAFFNCYSLTDISIPSSITSISNDTFYCCTSLENIIIPDTVTTIGMNAFRNCHKLTNVTIPASVAFIGICAFADGRSDLGLTSAVFENTEGWKVRDPETVVDVTNPTQNAINLKSVYCTNEWICE